MRHTLRPVKDEVGQKSFRLKGAPTLFMLVRNPLSWAESRLKAWEFAGGVKGVATSWPSWETKTLICTFPGS
jgi:hypothetical protein